MVSIFVRLSSENCPPGETVKNRMSGKREQLKVTHAQQRWGESIFAKLFVQSSSSDDISTWEYLTYSLSIIMYNIKLHVWVYNIEVVDQL